LVVPLMPFCLGLGFLYSFTFFIPYFSKLIALLSFPLLYLLNSIIKIFSILPFSFFEMKIPNFLIFLFYFFLGLFIYRYRKHDSLNFYSNDI
jgi:hypothetical protein